ncbi:MAG: hypothetical protein AAFY41_15365, partial [Bacteroidota bacterium]
MKKNFIIGLILLNISAYAQFTPDGNNLKHSANSTTLTVIPESNSKGTHIGSGQTLNLIFNDNAAGNDFFTIRGHGNTFTTSTEFLRINHLGYLGIGTSNPTHKFEVHSDPEGSVAPMFSMASSDQNIIGVNSSLILRNSDLTNGNWSRLHFFNGNNSAGTSIATQFKEHNSSSMTADLVFVTKGAGNYAEKVRITGSGDVGIGITTPTQKFHISGSGLVKSLVESSDNHAYYVVEGAVGKGAFVDYHRKGDGRIWHTGLRNGNNNFEFRLNNQSSV